MYRMQIVVLNGALSDAEQDRYIRLVKQKVPVYAIEKLYLDVQGDAVDISFTLHRSRELQKMGGCCIGTPADWNRAKQAESRDTVPNRMDI